jgi:Lrp/AsnC family transcriptional regulator, leucine-responsive regulatory protein
MSVQPNNDIDDIDRRILEALAADARMSLKELAQAAGLCYPLQAIVRVRPLPGQLHVVERIIQETPEFVECDKVTGDDCFVARLVVRSMAQLDTILDKVAEKAETSTSMVKASPVKRRLPPLS